MIITRIDPNRKKQKKDRKINIHSKKCTIEKGKNDILDCTMRLTKLNIEVNEILKTRTQLYLYVAKLEEENNQITS